MILKNFDLQRKAFRMLQLLWLTINEEIVV